MPWMYDGCFVCGKRSVIHYDFLVEESFTTQTVSGRYTQYFDQSRIAGIARLTLCRDCLESTFHQLIAGKINPDGSPRPKYRDEVSSLYALWHQISSGIYENRPGAQQGVFAPAMDMARLFMTALGGDISLVLGTTEFFFSSLSPAMQTPAAKQLFRAGPLHISQIPPELRTALMYRKANAVIDPQFVLWVPSQTAQTPFTQTIRPEFSLTNSINLGYMFSCDYFYSGYYSGWLARRGSETLNQIRSLYDYYRTYLMGY